MMALDVDLERERLKRRRAIAEAQLASSMRPLDAPQSAGGVQARMSPLAPFAQIAQAMLADRTMSDVNTQEKALGQRARDDVAAALSEYQRAVTPTQAQPGTEGTEFGTSEYETPGRTPSAEEKRAAAFKLMGAAGGDPRDSAKLVVAEAMKAPEIKAFKPGDVLYQDGRPTGTTIPREPEKPRESDLATLQRELAAMPPNDPLRAAHEAKIKKLTTHAPAPSATAIAGKGDSKYVEHRQTADAEAVSKLYSAADGAVKSNRALDRIAASNVDAFAGAAAPIMSATANFLSSFGFESQALTNTAGIQQAIGEMLGNRMSELGARGLTDKDMEILRDNLPRVDQSRDSRRLVVAVLKKANHGTIAEAQAQLQHETKTYPELRRARRHAWEGYTIPAEGTTGNPDVDALIEKYTRGR